MINSSFSWLLALIHIYSFNVSVVNEFNKMSGPQRVSRWIAFRFHFAKKDSFDQIKKYCTHSSERHTLITCSSLLMRCLQRRRDCDSSTLRPLDDLRQNWHVPWLPSNGQQIVEGSSIHPHENSERFLFVHYHYKTEPVSSQSHKIRLQPKPRLWAAWNPVELESLSRRSCNQSIKLG